MNKKELDTFKSNLSSLVNIIFKKFDYGDILFIDSIEKRITKDKESIDVNEDSDRGIKVRIYDGEKFVEWCTSNTDTNYLKKRITVFVNKTKKVKGHKSFLGSSLLPETPINEHFTLTPKINPDSIPLKSKITKLNKFFNIISKEKKIINTRVIYIEESEVRVFATKHKVLSQSISNCRVILMPIVQASTGELRYHFESFFDNGYEVTNISEAKIKNCAKVTLKLINAKKITPGRYTAVLSPEVTGLLAHESFGHGMEADTIYKDRAKAKSYLNLYIAPKRVSIVDNPAFEGRNGSYFFDDEGNMSKPTYLIKEGIVGTPIADIHSAHLLAIPPGNNGRCESYDHKAYSRMSNTYFLAGKDKPSDMVKSVKNGIYLHYSSGGMEDPKGWGVQIQGCVGEKIKDGKLTGEFLYEIGISGYLPEILANITMVGNKLEVPGAGRCGKGHKEWVRVSEGGSHLKIEKLELA